MKQKLSFIDLNRIRKHLQGLFIVINILLIGFTASAQLKSDIVRYGMVLKFAENIEWPEKVKENNFVIGVIEETYSDSLLNIYSTLEKVKLQGKPVKIKRFKKLSDVQGVKLLYLNIANPTGLKETLNKLSADNVLLVTNELQDKKLVMINLYQENEKQKFEINKANIINSGLTTKPKLILLGGTEIDVASLYKDTKEDLDREKTIVKQQQHQLAKMEQEIESKRKEIEEQQQKIQEQIVEIENKKQSIQEQKNTLKDLSFNVGQQEKLLREKVILFDQQQSKLRQSEKAIKEKESVIEERNHELSSISEKIKGQKEELSKQKLELSKQNAVIEIQKNLIYIFIGFLILVLALAFQIFRSYRNQKRFAKRLEEKNLEISSQKEELQVQAENLNKANYEIEQLYGELKDSIKAAQVIQQSILPSHKTIRKYIPEFFILNKPKDVVSGDFYWFDVKNDHIILAIVDCTGHGVSGALMSMIGHNLLNQTINNSTNIVASEILDNLNKGILGELHKDGENEDIKDGMDIGLCVISPDRKKLQFAGANNPLYILKNQTVKQIKANRFAIGTHNFHEIQKFTNHEIALEEGDVFYMFSDGYADQLGGATGSEKFMYPRFREVLTQIYLQEMSEQMIKLDQTFETWKGSAEQLDDILVLGFKV